MKKAIKLGRGGGREDWPSSRKKEPENHADFPAGLACGYAHSSNRSLKHKTIPAGRIQPEKGKATQ